MRLPLRRLSRRALLPVVAFALACGDPTVSIVADEIPGTYQAISFRVTPSGQPTVDVLAAGGSLNITIAADGSMSGMLNLPPGLISTAAISANMAGKLVPNADGTYWFNQTEDTFVRSLAWQQFTDAFVSTSVLSGVQFQITLKK
jgi:hypothetical protein